MKKLRKNDKPFENPPEGTYPATITVVCDLGLQESGYANRRYMLGLAFELDGLKATTGTPFAVFETFTHSLSEKAKIYPVIRAALGSVPEELDPEDLLGKVVLLEVAHRIDQQGKTWANVGSVLKLPDGSDPPVTDTPLLLFDLEEEDTETFSKLPALFKKRIENRVEEPEPVEADPDFDDELPPAF